MRVASPRSRLAGKLLDQDAGAVHHPLLRVLERDKLPHGLRCAQNRGADSLTIPLRVYCDVDTACLGEINQAVSGTIKLDALLITLRIANGVVLQPSVQMNDVYVEMVQFGVPACDDLISDMVSWIVSWTSGDFAEFIALNVQTEVEGAYANFAAACP